MSFVNAARNAAALSAAALSILCAASSHAQSTDDMARCRELYGLYNKYEANGRGATSAPNVEVAAAFGECQKGNYRFGIASLTKALERQRIPIPATEAAKAH
jgi:hypothetical protein